MADDSPRTLLEDAASRESGHEVSLTVRQLIGYWGALRRGAWIVRQINEALDEYGLVARPSFEAGWIDTSVTLIRSSALATTTLAAPELIDGGEPTRQQESLLKVRGLRSAVSDLISVNRTDSLETAQALMLRFDYSQLAVMSGQRELVGAVSWESVARQAVLGRELVLQNCILDVDVVDLDDELLATVPEVVRRGFVFVRGLDRRIVGIVTTADLSEEFQTLAEPYLLVGQAERCLREIARRHFSADAFKAAIDPRDQNRSPQSPEELSLGELVRLFQSRATWLDFGWAFDRKVFLDALDELNEVRNDIMHFTPDPIEPGRVMQLKRMVSWLAMLDL